MPEYVPRKGDFIAVSFDPQSGHEQKGRRPALVVSNDLRKIEHIRYLINQSKGKDIRC